MTKVTRHYRNGKVQCVYDVDENNRRNGVFMTFYQEEGAMIGPVAERCNYKDGKLNGLAEDYYENGQLEVRCNFKDDEFDGPYESYFKDGSLATKCNYKEGELDGSFEAYWENGQLWKKCTYKNGKFDGPYEEYDRYGELEEKSVYKDGECLKSDSNEPPLKKALEGAIRLEPQKPTEKKVAARKLPPMKDPKSR